MNNQHLSRLDTRVADRLLDQDGRPPPGLDGLVRLLVAASAPARPGELVGEPDAAAAYRAVRLGRPDPLPDRRRPLRTRISAPRWLRTGGPVRAGVLAAVVVAVGGGATLAATSGALREPSTTTARPRPDVAVPAAPVTPSGTAPGTAAPPAAHLDLCRAYAGVPRPDAPPSGAGPTSGPGGDPGGGPAGGRPSGTGQTDNRDAGQTDDDRDTGPADDDRDPGGRRAGATGTTAPAPAADLVAAAGGVDRVAAYCAAVLAAADSATSRVVPPPAARTPVDRPSGTPAHPTRRPEQPPGPDRAPGTTPAGRPSMPPRSTNQPGSRPGDQPGVGDPGTGSRRER
ncbi:hypothetical protein [Plantactinospora sp. B24E8]|uniref:hypothetical protein n=1 Tax=Plantactinospora sp. B24E8 TaxID=3153567 RepID=UPI00325D4210